MESIVVALLMLVNNEIKEARIQPNLSTCLAGKRKANEYSGDYIVGLATMHKSNIVPVGKGNSAEDYAKMRR